MVCAPPDQFHHNVDVTVTVRTGIATRANRRMDPAYQLDETFAWFVPGKKGDHDLKFGASW